MQKTRFIHVNLMDALPWLISCREEAVCMGSVCWFLALKIKIKDRDTSPIVARGKSSGYPNTAFRQNHAQGSWERATPKPVPVSLEEVPPETETSPHLSQYLPKPLHWRTQPFWPQQAPVTASSNVQKWAHIAPKAFDKYWGKRSIWVGKACGEKKIQ